ncbi:MAG: CAP domain-containing protein [Sinomonas sp.]|nr:CAP domain-containing protein [Sinomonas sp.]
MNDTAASPLAASVTSIQPIAAASHLVPDDNSQQVKVVFDAINAYRASLGLGRVYYHPTVASMAQEWSDSIASREVIEHRASFWTDPRALSPNNGAGEVIAVRWDRDAGQLVEWWKSSPAHNAILTDPRLNVMGIGLTFTDGTYPATPNRYAMWGVVDFFGYTSLPNGTVSAPASSTPPPPKPTPAPPGGPANPGSVAQTATVCDPSVRHMPPSADLSRASIHGPSDVIAVDASGTLWNFPSTGTGSVGPRVAIATGLSGAVRVLSVDWDRDGVYDVLVQSGDGRVTLLPGSINGGFGTSTVIGQSGWASFAIAAGEWCARNRLPQLLAKDPSGNVFLYPNRGLTDLAQRTFVATVSPTSVLAMADIDGDGFQDLLTLDGGTLTVRRGTGDVGLATTAPRTLAADWGNVRSFRVASGPGQGPVRIVAFRADGTAFTAAVTAGQLSPPVALAGNFAGLTLAG